MIDHLSVEDVLEVADRVTGGTAKVRDAGLLASAIVRPQTKLFGQEAYAGLWLKAAALMESLGRNHALIDGNKRLAWTAAGFLLGVNGQPLDEDGAEAFVHDVVSGRLDLPAIAEGLRKYAAA